MVEAPQLYAAGCACVTVTIFIVIMISISISTLPQGEYGFIFSHWSQQPVGNVTTIPGIKHVGPLNGLVRYPSVHQIVYFDNWDDWEPDSYHETLRPRIQSRTKDGLQVSVKVSFQWQLDAGSLAEIYKILGGAEDLLSGGDHDKPSLISFIVRLARGCLTEVCAEYSAQEFFANQPKVEAAMLTELSSAFDLPEKNLKVLIKGLQLRSVDLPEEYEKSIAETQAEEQKKLTAEAERQTNLTIMATNLMLATRRQDYLKLDAEANSKKIELDSEAWIEQYMLFQSEQAAAYGKILEQLTEDRFENLFELMSQKALKEHQVDKTTLTM